MIAPSLVAAFGSQIRLANGKPLTYAMPDDTAEFRPRPVIEAAQDHGSGATGELHHHTAAKDGETFWRAEVTKLIKAQHAHIEETDVDAIVDYLKKNQPSVFKQQMCEFMSKYTFTFLTIALFSLQLSRSVF